MQENIVINYKKDGTVLSTFALDAGEQAWGLALDPADDSLWLPRLNNYCNPCGTPILEKYSKKGKLLGKLKLTGLNGYIPSGMEFRLPHLQ